MSFHNKCHWYTGHGFPGYSMVRSCYIFWWNLPWVVELLKSILLFTNISLYIKQSDNFGMNVFWCDMVDCEPWSLAKCEHGQKPWSSSLLNVVDNIRHWKTMLLWSTWWWGCQQLRERLTSIELFIDATSLRIYCKFDQSQLL